jgi:hypothetical protein
LRCGGGGRMATRNLSQYFQRNPATRGCSAVEVTDCSRGRSRNSPKESRVPFGQSAARGVPIRGLRIVLAKSLCNGALSSSGGRGCRRRDSRREREVKGRTPLPVTARPQAPSMRFDY